jgi:hypothetical protein
MSALSVATTATIYRESLGSLTLLMVPLTGLSTTDTWTYVANAPVLQYWAQPNIGSTSTSVIDVTWTASTGTFTFSTVTNSGAFTLFILMRSA